MIHHWLKERSKFIFLGVTTIVLLATLVSNISVVGATPAADRSPVNISDPQTPDTHLGETARAPTLSPTLSISDDCKGPVIYLTGVTTTRYRNNTVADGTLFDRTAWYSDAVGNGTNTAFSVGSGDPPPLDICVYRGVINGHIPLDWTWDQIHSFGDRKSVV